MLIFHKVLQLSLLSIIRQSQSIPSQFFQPIFLFLLLLFPNLLGLNFIFSLIYPLHSYLIREEGECDLVKIEESNIGGGDAFQIYYVLY